MKRGDVYYVKSGVANNAGYTMWTPRPAVILSVDDINESEHTVEVAFLTTSPKRDNDYHVRFMCKDRYATALCEQITTVDSAHLSEYMMHVPDSVMDQISNAAARSLGITTSYLQNDQIEDDEDEIETEEYDWEAEAQRWKNLYLQQLKITAEVLNDR
jgi:mRNA-degrading endonuclease toxin of MazEF toxin-antitoxin module